MIPDLMFEQNEVAETAFWLLTSSSVERYVRMAKQAAWRIQSHHQFVIHPERMRQLVTLARNRWECLLGSTQRDTPEVELAILLCMLAQNAAPEVDGLLLAVAIVDRPGVAWIAALARRLLQERASNHTEVAWQGQPPVVSRISIMSPSLNALEGGVVVWRNRTYTMHTIGHDMSHQSLNIPKEQVRQTRFSAEGDTEVYSTFTHVAT